MISTVKIDEKEWEKASGLALNYFRGPLVQRFSNVNSAIWGGPAPIVQLRAPIADRGSSSSRISSSGTWLMTASSSFFYASSTRSAAFAEALFFYCSSRFCLF